MKNIFIINPRAGKSSAVKRLTGAIEAFFQDHKDTYEIHITQSQGDGTRIAQALAKRGEPLRIFACGGDGTACDVLNGIAGYDHVAMGVIPCGTGNDFLKYFEHAERFSCLEDQLNGSECKLDAIRAGERYCLNQATVGLDAMVCAHKDKFSRLPFVGGQFAYVLALLYCFFFAIKNRFRVQVDGNPPAEREYLLAVAANGRYYGGGFQSAPKALVNDGLLECITIDSVSRFRILSLLRRYSQGKHLTLPICTYLRGKTMTVQADKETVINLDGEVYFSHGVTFEVVPDFVRFILPRGCALPAGENVPAQRETVGA